MPARVAGGQHLCRALEQARGRRGGRPLRERPVRGVADQDVPEAERLAGGVRLGATQERPPLERFQGGWNRVALVLVAQLLDGVTMEVLPLDRAALGGVPLEL